MDDSVKENFFEARDILEAFISDEANFASIEKAGNIMADALKAGAKIISCGNGGSMCDAVHFAEELSGRFRDDRKPLAAISISDPGHISCVANDYGYEFTFSRFVEGIGKAGDVLLAISTSGNSKNVLNAAKSARSMNMSVIALTGKDGGELKDLCELEIRAPQSDYADRAQEIHIKVIHALIRFIENRI